MKTTDFQEIVWQYAKNQTRQMPWRDTTEPYDVLVSEIMLQQTQVERVIPKFLDFIARFPVAKDLARADLGEALKLWNGLGYNRRAKYLWQAARMIEHDFCGRFPDTQAQLMKLPGVGRNTAGAIMAYSFNQPAVFVETNIRTVFFNHFPELTTDMEILAKVQQTLDKEFPRQWYWALMDYGAFLKKNGRGRLTQGAHYKKQSALKGSQREMRGRIIKALTTGPLSETRLRRLSHADERFEPALKALESEQLVSGTDGIYRLA